MTTADRIRIRREQLGMSQLDLALKIGLKNKTSVTKIEQSGDKVTLKNIEKIAKALNCSQTYLLGYEDDGSREVVLVETNADIDYLVNICRKLNADDIQTLTDMAKVFESRRK